MIQLNKKKCIEGKAWSGDTSVWNKFSCDSIRWLVVFIFVYNMWYFCGRHIYINISRIEYNTISIIHLQFMQSNTNYLQTPLDCKPYRITSGSIITVGKQILVLASALCISLIQILYIYMNTVHNFNWIILFGAADKQNVKWSFSGYKHFKSMIGRACNKTQRKRSN